jgi:hypothetical protein
MKRVRMAALLFAVVVLFNWKLLLTNQYTWLESPDINTQVMPWLQFQAGEWHRGRFPLWDPTSWFGQPLFGQAQPGSAYPPNWLLFLMPLRHGWLRESVLHWYYVLIRFFAALTSYALCRELGRSRAASVLGACLYALGGYVGNTVWPQMVQGAVWSPLALLYLLRAEKGERRWSSALLSGFFLVIGWLGGHHQMNLFVSLAIAGIWAWLCLRRVFDEGRPNGSMIKLAAASLIVAALASGFQTLPTAEYGRLAVRWTSGETPFHFDEATPYTVHSEYALHPVGLLGIFIPNVEPGWPPYVGIAGFMLALVGAVLAWREQQVRWLAMMSLGGILLALGPNSLLHGVLYALAPLVEKSRVPAAATIVFTLGLAPLAAFGLDALPRPESSAWSQRAGRVLLAVCCVLSAASLIFLAAKIQNQIYDHRMMVTALAAAVAAAVLAGWRSGALSAGAGKAAFIGLALFELANVTNYQLPNVAVPAQNTMLHLLGDHGDVAAFIRGRGEQARVEYDEAEIPYNFGAWWGLDTTVAVGASVLANVWGMDLFSERTRDFFGVRFHLGKTPNRKGQREVLKGAHGVNVFENYSAFPRAWSVHRAVVVPAEQVPLRFRDTSVDLRRTAILWAEPRPALEDCRADADDVDMPVHQPNYVRITARLGCRGMVILTDSFFPGWRATVDGRAVEIVEAYGGVRGVPVDRGVHVVEMRYRPLSVMLGGAMTLLAAALVVWVRRRDVRK